MPVICWTKDRKTGFIMDDNNFRFSFFNVYFQNGLFSEMYLEIGADYDNNNKYFFLQISEDPFILEALEYHEVYPWCYAPNLKGPQGGFLFNTVIQSVTGCFMSNGGNKLWFPVDLCPRVDHTVEFSSNLCLLWCFQLSSRILMYFCGLSLGEVIFFSSPELPVCCLFNCCQ